MKDPVEYVHFIYKFRTEYVKSNSKSIVPLELEGAKLPLYEVAV